MSNKNRNIPKELVQKQECQRNETIRKVQSAINELITEGALITTAKLIDRTGLSRSTINKPHVQNVLKDNQVGKYRSRIVISSNTAIEDQLAKLEKELSSVKINYEEEHKRRIRLQEEKKNLDYKYQMLLGKYHRTVFMAKNYGVPIDFDEEM